jgi:hypothetical protein
MRLPARTPNAQLVLVAAMIFLALGASAAALDTASEVDGLFCGSSIPGTLGAPAHPAVMRHRYVDVDFGKLTSAHGSPRNIESGSTQLPSAPVDLVATPVSPTRIDLSWRDTCEQESGFGIERLPAGVSGWAQIGSASSNVTFCSDLAVVAEAAHYYRVQASNDMGASDHSKVVAAMVPANIVGPLVYEDHVVDDDRAGTSDGNRSGLVDCGETIELKVSLANQGYAEVTGVVAELAVADPHVSWTGNMLSSYPIIEGLASDLNREAFEFAVAQSTPNGHLIHFDLAVVADNWGPGTIEFDVPVFCSANAQHHIYLPVVFR